MEPLLEQMCKQDESKVKAEPECDRKPPSKPKCEEKINEKAEWDYKARRAEIWVKGVCYTTTAVTQKNVSHGKNSRMLATFEIEGQSLVYEVAGAWWWMRNPPEPDASLTGVFKAVGAERDKKKKLQGLKVASSNKPFLSVSAL